VEIAMLTDAGPRVAPTHPKEEWVQRFAYRAMLVQASIDSVSAAMIAESQFEEACDLEPEEAAEIFVSRE
jgi:hypothetical protein